MRPNLEKRAYKILMVDDDEDDIFTVRRSILASESDFQFSAVSSSEALFSHLKELGPNLPDVMVLDINMPRMNGFEVLDHLKSIKAWSGIPVMVLSTSAHDADRAQALQLGAINFTTKFSSMKELIAWVGMLENFLQARS